MKADVLSVGTSQNGKIQSEFRVDTAWLHFTDNGKKSTILSLWGIISLVIIT